MLWQGSNRNCSAGDKGRERCAHFSCVWDDRQKPKYKLRSFKHKLSVIISFEVQNQSISSRSSVSRWAWTTSRKVSKYTRRFQDWPWQSPKCEPRCTVKSFIFIVFPGVLRWCPNAVESCTHAHLLFQDAATVWFPSQTGGGLLWSGKQTCPWTRRQWDTLLMRCAAHFSSFQDACLGLARTVYMHRIWPCTWWSPCQKYRIYTVYTWFWPILHMFAWVQGACLPKRNAVWLLAFFVKCLAIWNDITCFYTAAFF